MPKPRILLQLDPDPQSSVFDSVVAIDAGVDHLLRHGGVKPEAVAPLVHGTIFTRGDEDLRRTAIFVGGSDVAAGEALAAAVRKAFFGPMRVSLLIDPNGANTTAAAAVLCAARHVGLAESRAVVLGGTGPVGQRLARLLARQGAEVCLASRSADKASATCRAIGEALGKEAAARLRPAAGDGDTLCAALASADLLFAAGAAGAELWALDARNAAPRLRVAIDLNAVPPLGIRGIDVGDKARDRDGLITFGALGVGGTKMKIHRAALARLFEANNLVLDAEEVLELGQASGL